MAYSAHDSSSCWFNPSFDVDERNATPVDPSPDWSLLFSQEFAVGGLVPCVYFMFMGETQADRGRTYTNSTLKVTTLSCS